MMFKIFAVFDAKAAFFGQPFFAQNEGSAIRDFSDAVLDGSNPNNMWHKHPEDFSLFYIGDYDSINAEIIPMTPRSLLTASALVQLGVADPVKIQNKSHKLSEEILQ